MRIAQQQQAIRERDANSRDQQAERDPQGRRGPAERAAYRHQRHGDRRREQRQDRHDEPRGRAVSSPPHVQPRRADQIRNSRRDQRHRQTPPIGIANETPHPHARERVYRAVDQQTELLIDQQPEQTAGKVLEADVLRGVRAVRHLGINAPVDHVEIGQPGQRQQPDRRRECRRLPDALPQTPEQEQREDCEQHDKLRVQPRQESETGAAPEPLSVVPGSSASGMSCPASRRTHGPPRQADTDVRILLQKPPHRPGHNRGAGHLRIQHPAVGHERDGQAD